MSIRDFNNATVTTTTTSCSPTYNLTCANIGAGTISATKIATSANPTVVPIGTMQIYTHNGWNHVSMGPSIYDSNRGFQQGPYVQMHDSSLNLVMDYDGNMETISRDELVKYIGERKMREENMLVRTQWDRYQVAVKLVRSTDDGRDGP